MVIASNACRGICVEPIDDAYDTITPVWKERIEMKDDAKEKESNTCALWGLSHPSAAISARTTMDAAEN